MVFYTDIETETRFREFLINSGCKHGDITHHVSKAINEYIDRQEVNR